MFNPEGKDYGLNRDGQPEFGTITITIDEVSNNPELGEDVVQKMVLSTQDLITAIAAQARYFNDPMLLASPTHGRLLVESGRQRNPVFVYVTPRNDTTQIITSTATWAMLVEHPDFGKGSLLLAVDALMALVANSLSNAANFLGGIPALTLLDVSPEKFHQEQPAGTSADEGTLEADLAGANAAETLRDSASVIEE